MRKIINLITYGFIIISLISSIFLYINSNDGFCIIGGFISMLFFLIMNFVSKYFFKV